MVDSTHLILSMNEKPINEEKHDAFETHNALSIESFLTILGIGGQTDRPLSFPTHNCFSTCLECSIFDSCAAFLYDFGADRPLASVSQLPMCLENNPSKTG